MTESVDRGRRRDLALLKAGVSAVVARAGSSLTTLLLTPILARILGIESFGVLLTLTAASALLLLGNLGIASGLVSRLAANEGSPDTARTVLSSAYAIVMVTSAVGLVVAALFAILLPWSSWASATGVSARDIHVCAFIAMCGTALQMTLSLGQQIELSQQRGHAAAWWLGLANIGAPMAATVMALITEDLRWTIAGMALTPPLVMAIQTAGVLRRLPEGSKPRRSSVSWPMVRTLLASGGYFAGLALLGAMAFQLDILVVSAFLGSDAAAQYGVTARLFALLATTLQIAVTQLWSAFADARRHGDVVWIRRTLIRASVVCAAIGVVMSVVLMLAGAPLIRLWVGDEFVPPTSLLIAAAVWTAMVSAAGPLVFFLNGSEKERQQFLFSIPMAISNIGLSIWFVQTMGISGVVWASCISWFVFVLLPMTLISRNVLRGQAASAHDGGEPPVPGMVGLPDDVLTPTTETDARRPT